MADPSLPPARPFALMIASSGERLDARHRAHFDGVGLVRGEYLCRAAKAYVTQPHWHALASAYLAALCTLFAPHPVRYRLVDIETSELNGLPGVDHRVQEKTTMLGLRGARRALRYPAGAEAEAAMLASVHADHANLALVIPFVGDSDEAVRVRAIVRAAGFAGPVGVMLETPAATLGAGDFVAAGFASLTIGFNDLTSLTLGEQRETAGAKMRHPAVTRLVATARDAAPDAEILAAGYFDAAMIDHARALGLDGIVANASQLALFGWDALVPDQPVDIGAMMSRIRARVGDPQIA
ncbi:putative PEP-binding protein [Sphingomonas sp. 28-62-20]|uniref:putative PEP-binding protein n=1 Tax=Sphingomonas sp. 28-62-20 TaxID=1970433 RepID=UPI0026AC2153